MPTKTHTHTHAGKGEKTERGGGGGAGCVVPTSGGRLEHGTSGHAPSLRKRSMNQSARQWIYLLMHACIHPSLFTGPDHSPPMQAAPRPRDERQCACSLVRRRPRRAFGGNTSRPQTHDRAGSDEDKNGGANAREYSWCGRAVEYAEKRAGCCYVLAPATIQDGRLRKL